MDNFEIEEKTCSVNSSPVNNNPQILFEGKPQSLSVPTIGLFTWGPGEKLPEGYDLIVLSLKSELDHETFENLKNKGYRLLGNEAELKPKTNVEVSLWKELNPVSRLIAIKAARGELL